MKFAFTFLATFFLLEATPVMGAGVDMGKVAMDAKDLEQLESAAKRVLSKNQRTRNLSKKSSGKNDIKETLIKGMSCSGCLDAPFEGLGLPGVFDPQSGEAFIQTAFCEPSSDSVIWDLESLESSGTWFLFKNKGLEECMQLQGPCFTAPNVGDVDNYPEEDDFDGVDHKIKFGECDDKNPKAVWGLVGGHIINFECFINRDNTGTPDVLLEAPCSDGDDLTSMDLSSLGDDAEEAAEVYWVLFPKSFYDPDEDSLWDNPYFP